MNMESYFNEQRRRVDQALDIHLPSDDTRPAVLHQAMRYSLFSGGKRLRPILCLATAELFGAKEAEAMLPAIALEALHTYTLVHDDLPAMDDDDLRRGRPTAHKMFGVANAILIGDALLTIAFEWMAQSQAPNPYLPNQYALELAESAGSRGLIAGQVEDLAAPQAEPSEDLLQFIHLHKTAALIRASVRIGAIAGAASNEHLEEITLYGCHTGLAFQIADDLLDETATTEQIGKPAGSDRKNKKLTYTSLFGVERAKELAQDHVDQALSALSKLPGDTTLLADIARYFVTRTH